MTQAITVRRDGDIFQARQFWLRAARLLDPKSPIERVGFESGPKSFDDIWIEYVAGREPVAHNGTPLRREHLQCKWHVQPGSYGHADLIEPAFINANARSLLQRARDAQLQHAPDGLGARFKLVTNWHLDRGDPLGPMINTRSGIIRLDRLYGSKTDNSKAGGVRKVWREHLEIDEDELRVLAQTLAFGHASDTLEELRDRLDDVFASVGLRRVPPSQSALIYDDVIFQWMGQGRLEFDRVGFRKACANEDLLVEAEGRPRVYGVKSFEHAFDRLEERCESVLDFVPAFDERFVRDDADWKVKLYPELQAFLRSAAQDQSRLRLALDTHTTLAFAAGSVLERQVRPLCRAGTANAWPGVCGRRTMWPHDPEWPTLAGTADRIRTDRPDLAVALGITHDVSDDVRRFIDGHLSSVGTLLHLRPSGGAGAQVVTSGRHAFALAEAAKDAIRRAKAALPSIKTTHIFIAAPKWLHVFSRSAEPHPWNRATLRIRLRRCPQWQLHCFTDASANAFLALRRYITCYRHRYKCRFVPYSVAGLCPRLRKRGLPVDQGRVPFMAVSHARPATRIASPACPQAPPILAGRAGLHAQSSSHEGGSVIASLPRSNAIGQLQDLRSDTLGGIQQKPVGQVRIALGRHRIPMAEQTARHHQGFAAHDRMRGVGVAKIVQAKILGQAGFGADATPNAKDAPS